VEGNATLPGLGYGYGGDVARTIFGPDGSTLFYLVRKERPRAFNSGELWIADLKSAKSEPVFPGILMTDFDLSPDGKRIAFTSLNEQGRRRLWIAG
jgi:dipeptidyl aminopeptidase/acylaminoacyl peptidase